MNGVAPDGVVQGSGIFAGGWGAERAAVYGVEEEDLGAVKPPSMEVEGEADPPEPFEWAPPGHDDYREGLPPPSIPEPEEKKDEDSDDKEDEEGSKPKKREEDHEEDLGGPGLVGGAAESS